MHALLPCIHEILGFQDKALWHFAELISCGLQVLLADSVHLHNRSKVKKKIMSLIKGGKKKLQVGTTRQLS
jgi:hypothetical protein